MVVVSLTKEALCLFRDPLTASKAYFLSLVFIIGGNFYLIGFPFTDPRWVFFCVSDHYFELVLTQIEFSLLIQLLFYPGVCFRLRSVLQEVLHQVAGLNDDEHVGN